MRGNTKLKRKNIKDGWSSNNKLPGRFQLPAPSSNPTNNRNTNNLIYPRPRSHSPKQRNNKRILPYIASTPAEQLQANILGVVKEKVKEVKEKVKEAKKRFFEKPKEKREEAIVTIIEDIFNLFILGITQKPDPFGPWLPPDVNPLFPGIKEGDLIKS